MFTNIEFVNKLLKFVRQKQTSIALFAIVLLGAILRFTGFPLRYGFDIDATRDAILTQYASTHSLWPLIGPISALGSFNFGPWYYYQLITFQHLFPSLGYAPWIYITLSSLVVILVMYGIGKELINKQFGLTLALLTAVAPGQIIAGTGLSNPDLVSLFASLSLYLFIRLLKSNASVLSALLLGLSIGIGINCHYQMIYFLVLPLLSFVFIKKGRLKLLAISLFGIFLSFIPLIIFNFTHHWQTVTGLIDYYVFGKNKVYVPNRWLIYLFDFWPSFWGYLFGLPFLLGLLLMAGSTIISLTCIVKRKLPKEYLSIFLFFTICFVLLRFFAGEKTNYYLIFLHPFLILLSGVFLWQLLKIKFGKIIFMSLILLIVTAGLRVDEVHTHAVGSHLEFVKLEKYFIDTYPDKKFSIFACEGQYRDKSMGMVFLLSNDNLLGSDIKIGFKDTICRYPKDLLPSSETDKIGYVDLTDYSTEMLKDYGWTLVTPQNLYNTLLGY